MRVVDKVRHVKDIQRADFEYLKSQVSSGHMPKVTIPSPTMLHFRGGRKGISKDVYPQLDAFFDDLAKAYKDAVAFALLFVMLLARPQGLLGRAVVQKV